eukprot:363865-Chlamydomonas_euryale.AAC.34
MSPAPAVPLPPRKATHPSSCRASAPARLRLCSCPAYPLPACIMGQRPSLPGASFDPELPIASMHSYPFAFPPISFRIHGWHAHILALWGRTVASRSPTSVPPT